jgi:hypothetical protein
MTVVGPRVSFEMETSRERRKDDSRNHDLATPREDRYLTTTSEGYKTLENNKGCSGLGV